MTNINKLRGKIVEKGTNVSELASAMGIDKSTLYRKLKNNGEDISIGEANLIIKELKLTIEDVNTIFFNHFVALDATKRKNNKLERRDNFEIL